MKYDVYYAYRHARPESTFAGYGRSGMACTPITSIDVENDATALREARRLTGHALEDIALRCEDGRMYWPRKHHTRRKRFGTAAGWFR